MKIILSIITVFVCSYIQAAKNPPPPPTTPVPPGLSIDSGIILLIVISLTLAFFQYYSKNQRVK